MSEENKKQRKFLVTNISFAIEDEDLNLDPDDFGSGCDYYEACKNLRQEICESLPTEMIITIDDDVDEDDLDCEICDKISDQTGWLVNDGFYFKEV